MELENTTFIPSLQTLEEAQFDLLQTIKKEYEQGFLALNSLGNKPTVTFYGGSMVKPTDKAYNGVFEISSWFATKGFGVVSGGGPGIMEAALKGAITNNGEAVAFKIDLSGEPIMVNPSLVLTFTQFSVRKYLLRQSDVYVFAPGGLGTLDELMEVLTLMKTHKFPIKPLFLYDSIFWKGYVDWFKEILLKDRGVVSADFLDLFKLVDSVDEIEQILKL
jgi:uncharacterized protein (TIGR00730 family)